VHVDEPRHDVGAAGVQGATGRSGAIPYPDDSTALDRDVALEGRAPRTVDNQASHDLQIDHSPLLDARSAHVPLQCKISIVQATLTHFCRGPPPHGFLPASAGTRARPELLGGRRSRTAA
jgi:hypothetical protein